MSRINFINNYLSLLFNTMTQLNLPSLNLFNKTPFKSHRTYEGKSSRQGSPLRDIIKETNRIDQQIYAPYLPYRPTLYDQQYARTRNSIELEYLNAYNETVRNAHPSSYHSTQRLEHQNLQGVMSFRKQQPHPCDCEYQVKISPQKMKPIVKTPYINHQYIPTVQPKNTQNQKAKYPTKDVYLDNKRPQRQEPDVSIINRINKSMLQTQKNNIQTNLSKMINDSNFMNTNQSVILDIPPPPRPQVQPPQPIQPPQPPQRQQTARPTVSYQVQTDEIANKSFIYVDNKRQKMDQVNFQKTIRQLNHQLNNLNLELPSEDVIIDLSDLVNTKEQYFEESNEILNSLNALSDQRIMIKSHRQGQMIWPHY